MNTGLFPSPGQAVASLEKAVSNSFGRASIGDVYSQPPTLLGLGLYSLMNASNTESVVHANEIICCD